MMIHGDSCFNLAILMTNYFKTCMTSDTYSQKVPFLTFPSVNINILAIKGKLTLLVNDPGFKFWKLLSKKKIITLGLGSCNASSVLEGKKQSGIGLIGLIPAPVDQLKPLKLRHSPRSCGKYLTSPLQFCYLHLVTCSKGVLISWSFLGLHTENKCKRIE